MEPQLTGIADVANVGKLECNPFGAYGWLEDELGFPITAALGDLLTTGVSRTSGAVPA